MRNLLTQLWQAWGSSSACASIKNTYLTCLLTC